MASEFDGSTEAPRPPESQKARILYVNDDRSITLLSTRMFEHHGYQVTSFVSPADAIREFKARPHDFDAVVADMSMPEMSGLDFLRQVQSTRPDIPCVLSSSYLRPDDARAASELGMHPLTVDPFFSSEVNLLRSLLGR